MTQPGNETMRPSATFRVNGYLRLFWHDHSRSIAVLLMGAALTVACSPESAVTQEDLHVSHDTLPGGALLIRYGSLPEPVVDLSVDLQIGVMEGEPHEVFGDVRSIEADGNGTIYVLDHQASQVRAFDSTGHFLRALTRRGQGPGELIAANGMVLDSTGTLWIQDHGQWQFIAVDSLGEEVSRVPMHVRSFGYVWDGTIDDRGRLWKSTTHSDEPVTFPPEPGLIERRARSYLKWLDPAAGVSDSVFVGEVTQRMHVTRTAGGGWLNRSIPFSHRRLEIVDPGGGFWLAADGSYRVVRLNENGDTSLVLEVEVPEEPVTNADRQRFTEESLERSPDQRRAVEELIELSPSTKPVINQLHVDDEGRLWVRRRTNDNADSHYDIFAREGQYLGSIRLLFSPVVHFPTRVRDGKLYTLTADSLGVHTVVRAALPSLRAVH